MSTTKSCEANAVNGDVTGLLDWMRSRSPDQWPPDIMAQLAKAIRKLGHDDLPQLIETAFAEILGFAVIVLTRAQAHVEQRLRECDAQSGDRTHLPYDLDKEGWLNRVERISRFIAEIASARARVQHVGRLNERLSAGKSPNGSIARGRVPFDLRPATPAPLPAGEASGNITVNNGRLFFE